MAKLCEIYADGARLDDALLVHLINPEAWERLRDVLAQTNFAPEIQPHVTGRGLYQSGCIRL
jgi:hypothetical protein